MNSEDKAQMFNFFWRVNAPLSAPVPTPEFPFSDNIGRKHRFDFAFVERKVAVEIEGNAWQVAGGGRHMADTDLEKYNLAVLLGWKVIRFSPGMLQRDPAGCVETVLKILEIEHGQ